MLNNNVEELKKMADRKIEIAFTNNDILGFVINLPSYNLYMFDERGNIGNNTTFLMEALYRYYKKHPKENIDKKFYDVLLRAVNIGKTSDGLLAAYDKIIYQMIAEKNGNAPFKLDNKALLKGLKDNIEKNMEYFSSSRLQDDKFFDKIAQRDEVVRTIE